MDVPLLLGLFDHGGSVADAQRSSLRKNIREAGPVVYLRYDSHHGIFVLVHYALRMINSQQKRVCCVMKVPMPIVSIGYRDYFTNSDSEREVRGGVGNPTGLD
jgi:hypothetical protein